MRSLFGRYIEYSWKVYLGEILRYFTLYRCREHSLSRDIGNTVPMVPSASIHWSLEGDELQCIWTCEIFSPCKYFCLSQVDGVELGLADCFLSSIKVISPHVFTCPICRPPSLRSWSCPAPNWSSSPSSDQWIEARCVPLGLCSLYLWINCVPYIYIMWNISISLPNKLLMNTFEMKVLCHSGNSL